VTGTSQPPRSSRQIVNFEMSLFTRKHRQPTARPIWTEHGAKRADPEASSPLSRFFLSVNSSATFLVHTLGATGWGLCAG